MNASRSLRTSDRSCMKMQQKNRRHDSFFGLKGSEPRPSSIATEIVDTEWDHDDDDDEIFSDIEDDSIDSPRISLNSSGGQRSITTLSSYEEAHTPRSSRTREVYPFGYESSKPVEGPRGPHLFRSSSSSQSIEYETALSLSPITPKAQVPLDTGFRVHFEHEPLPTHLSSRLQSGPFRFSHEELERSELREWSPEMVAQWLLNAGVESHFAERFIENDISGAIIIMLKSEDLKGLGIHSLGIRMKIWEYICKLRDTREESPRPETPIEDEECKEVKRERKMREREEDHEHMPKRCVSKKRLKRPSHDDIISPLESVSIVGIEQLMPKPHNCSKGENCSKWKKHKRMLEEFKKEHPFVDHHGGIIMIAGDPGNASTAEAINRPSSTEVFRPFSDAVPSVVASSDVMGPGSAGFPPFQYLEESNLRNVQSQDPQDNVKQFLSFQHQHDIAESSEVPPTPPFEIYPPARPAHEGLRALPRLSIPSQVSAKRNSVQKPSNLSQEFIPRRMSKAEPLAEDLATPVGPYRFGTPFSDMDVPVTAIPLGPVARDASQSVPPDMGYRMPTVPVRTLSRASKRPSFQIMAPLDENTATPIARTTPKPLKLNLSPKSPETSPPGVPARSQDKLRAPPRMQYPWSAQPQRTVFERTLPQGEPLGELYRDAEGITYQGPVRKRKTKMLRHEWHDHYATLKGTRLALHKDGITRERTLEYIDVDDYAIACSSLASSKLKAAFKAMSISQGKDSKSADIAAFSFQLIPQGKEGFTTKVRKREASISSLSSAAPDGMNGTGKTHHFAVRSRDERIDWMRELMLAKALKQKGEGFEVSVNGNMI